MPAIHTGIAMKAPLPPPQCDTTATLTVMLMHLSRALVTGTCHGHFSRALVTGSLAER
jgi:hypothetical protein